MILTTEHHAYNETAAAAKQKAHHSTGAKMRALARALGLPAGTYSVRSNTGGVAVSGEVTLHGETIYVKAGCSCDLLVRTCAGRRDFTGGRNHWFSPELLNTPETLAASIRKQVLGIPS